MWRFPQTSIIDALGPFTLDPCCAPDLAPDFQFAQRNLSRNGLNATWEGFVWLNLPSYEKPWPWLVKLQQHGNGVALLPSRPGSEEWQRIVWPYATVFFLRGRQPCFWENGDQETFPQEMALLCYGIYAQNRLRRAQARGLLAGVPVGRTGPIT